MTPKPFSVEILTPEGEAFNGEVEMLSTRTATGEIGILARHQPLLALLDPTELRLHRAEGEILRFAQGEGYLQVADSHAFVLIDELIPVDQLDTSDLTARVNRAEIELVEAEPDSEASRAAERDRRRYEAFLEVTMRHEDRR